MFTDTAAAPNAISLLDDFQSEGRNIKLVARPVSDNYFGVMGIRPHLGGFFRRQMARFVQAPSR